MPLARYFLWVGGVLLALLFVADARLPALPVAEATTDVPSPIIRIHSERKWPDRIVFDTNAPIPRINLAAILACLAVLAIVPLRRWRPARRLDANRLSG